MKKWMRMAVGGCLGTLLLCGAWASAAGENEADLSALDPEVAEQMSTLDMTDLLENREDGQYDAVITAAPYAYMDLDSISDEATQEKILEARETIIFSQDWSADKDEPAVVIDMKTGEVVEESPWFYDIFPADWEIPSDETSAEGDVVVADTTAQGTWNEDIIAQTTSSVVLPPYIANVYLRKPGSTISSDYGEATIAGGCYCGAYASSLPGATWNCGFRNASTGTNLAWKTYLTKSQIFAKYLSSTTSVGYRASTYSTKGYAKIGYGLVSQS